MPSQCRSDSIMFSLLSQNVCDLLWISSQYWCDSAAVSCPQNVCYLVWSLENVDLTLRLLHSRRAYVILFNDCTMLMWLYTAPTERMFSCLIWSLDNVDLTPTGSMLYCLIPEQCRSDSESTCSLSLPQKVCYFWSLDKIDFHHRSHSMYVILLNPCTMSILLHYILVAQTGSMLYCLIPV